jgi:para-aminobenzoate synthetase component 1
MGTSPILGSPFVADVSGLTPWDVCRRLAKLPHLVFFDSAAAGPQSRYSYVSANPRVWLESPREPFALLRELLAGPRYEHIPRLPPFQGGIAGLFGYGLAHHIETLPRPIFDDFRVPDLAVGLYDWVVAFDHAARKSWLIVAGPKERGEPILQLLDRVPPALPWSREPPLHLSAPQYPVPGREPLTSNFDRPSYLTMLRRALDYIHAGDCFQANLSQRLTHPLTAPPLEIYDRLRTRNAAPFAGYLDLGDFVLASASPERFLRVTDGEVETRPIKGTRPRGVYPMEDMARGEDLLESLKDRAENVMIVDLLRNDLGRVCEFGSIRVSQVCQLETFRYVHHLVSEIRGRLRPGLDAVDLLKATFPGGSVTGAPKIRAMEIITELERVARGAYCGCLGYIGFDGGMDTNLLIRTMVLGRGWIQFSVGGGIVADSSQEREYEETWHKAAGLLRALED